MTSFANSTPNTKPATQYLSEIDGLRAIAVLSVIAFHFSHDVLPNGFLGVDIFFVISGYVISASLASRQSDSLISALIAFYARRVKRLLPALAVCVLVGGILAFVFNPLPGPSVITGVLSLFGLANLNLYRMSTDYFDAGAESNFFTQTWSLGVEEQFYFIFPLFFLLLVRPYKGNTNATLFIIFFSIVTLVSVALFVIGSERYANAAFYLLPFRLWEIGAGVLIFHVLNQYKSKFAVSEHYGNHNRIVLLLTLGLLLVLLLPHQYTAAATIVCVVLTGLTIASIHLNQRHRSFLASKTLVHLGKISYSLYLWHWTVLVLSYWTIGVSPITVPAQLLCIYVLALLSYRYVENPLRHKTWSSSKIKEILLGIAMAIAILAVMFAILYNKSAVKFLYAGNLDDHRGVWTAQSTLLAQSDNTESSQRDDLADSLLEYQNKKIKCHLTPHFVSASHRFHNDKPVVDDQFLSSCIGTENKQVIVMGDSYSNVIADHILLAAEEIGYETNILFGYHCPYPFNPDNFGWSNKSSCEVDPEILQRALSQYLKPGDILVVRSFFHNTQFSNSATASAKQAVGFMDSELEELVSIVEDNGAKLLIVGTNGLLNRTSPCTIPHWFNTLQCPSARFDFDIQGLALNRFAQQWNKHVLDRYHANRSVHVVDPIALLCNSENDLCPAYKEGLLYYRENDYSHLSAGAVDLLYPAIRRALSYLSSQNSWT